MRLVLLLFLSIVSASAGTVETYLAKGDAADAKNKPLEALPLYLSADQLRPDNAETLWRIAKQYSDLSEKKGADTKDLNQKALEAGKRARQIDPENSKARLILAIVYGRIALTETNRKKVELSRLIKEEAEAAIRLNSREDYAHHILGRWNYEMASVNPVLKTMGQAIYGRFPDASYDKAAEHLQKATEIAPRQISHHFELGRVYLALGQKDKAGEEFRKAIALPASGQDDGRAKQQAAAALQKL